MKAICWQGKKDLRCEEVPDPIIQDPKDAIVRVTSTCICGSDLHLMNGFVPTMCAGDVMGHEPMGEVVEVGAEARAKGLKVGDRVVVPFQMICGECEQCRAGNYSICQVTNRNADLAKAFFGDTTAGLFGYSHITGGYAGGQAEYMRVPFAATTLVKVPSTGPDEKYLFLSDILPTGWQAARFADIQPTDTVAVWGCGPVGLFTIQSALIQGARRVIAIDDVPERLRMAAGLGAEVLDRSQAKVIPTLKEMTGGYGPEKCIDAVGLEAHGPNPVLELIDRAQTALKLETERPIALREAIMVC
ncbi:MAG: alcohol dehydrogenase catalytic domain-containing protein, partial [Caulobacter sp.]|nr:alcohol dehydrogenase catalytic domain-containing protein [Caulobacter sp.]